MPRDIRRISWAEFATLTAPAADTPSAVTMVEFAPHQFVASGVRTAMPGGRTYVRQSPVQGYTRVIPDEPDRPRRPPRIVLHPRPANDNRPAARVVPMPNDGPTPDWLARRNAAGCATSYGKFGSRVERALLTDVATDEAAAHAVVALRHLREIVRPAELVAANDNALIDDGETEESRSHGLERVHNQSAIVPSIPKLLRAFADGMRCRVTKQSDGTLRRADMGVRVWTGRDRLSTVHIGGYDGRRFVGLQFIAGRLEFYGDRGRKCRVDYKTKVSAANPSREDIAEARLDELCGTASYLRLRGTPMPEPLRLPDVPRPLPGVIPPGKGRLRTWLAEQCAGMPVTICPPGVAAVWRRDGLGLECGYGRLGGVSEAIGVGEGKTMAPAHASLNEINRSVTESDFTDGLSKCEQAVLDALLDGESFAAIAAAAGKNPTSHNGRRVAVQTLQNFNEKIAA